LQNLLQKSIAISYICNFKVIEILKGKTFKNVISREPPFKDLFDAQRYPLNLNLSNNEDTSLFLILKRDKFCKFPSLLMLQKSKNCIDTEKPQFSDRKFENVCSDFGG